MGNIIVCDFIVYFSISYTASQIFNDNFNNIMLRPFNRFFLNFLNPDRKYLDYTFYKNNTDILHHIILLSPIQHSATLRLIISTGDGGVRERKVVGRKSTNPF